MFIRTDLEEAIKDKFSIEKFVYMGIGKKAFSDCDLFIFDTGKGIIVIEVGILDVYYIYKAKKRTKRPGQFFKVRKEISTLYTFGKQTCLKTNDVITEFPGKAFDFTEELVLLALENC